MGHPTQRGVCPDMACELIRQEVEKVPTKTAAFKSVAERLGVPWRTIETWHTRSRQVTEASLHRTVTVQNRELEVVLTPEPEAGGFSVACPELPGCHSQGETEEEALEMIQDAATGWLEVAAERKADKPKPKVYRLNPTDEEVVVSEEFKAAFKAMLAAIQNARAEGWKATPKKAALHHIDVLFNVINAS